jgi:two-component system cell cycle sensor histidine kinase/response regulator CckA
MSVSLTPTNSSAHTILIVEDSDVVRTLTGRMLVDEGYPVVTAIDGVEAIEVLERCSVAVVVTDLKMPRMNGRELAVQVAARWPDVRMLFMTGHPEAELTRDLPGPLLMKPFAPEALAAAVRALVTDRDGGLASA